MADDLGDIFSNFGCFDDSADVRSLFEDLENFNTLPNSNSSPTSGSGSPEHEMMSIGSPASPSDPESDHLYSSNPVMTGAVSPEQERSPSPGGSLSSEENSRDLLLYLMNETGVTVSEREVNDDSDASSEHAQQLQQNQKRGRKRRSSVGSEDADPGKTQEKNRKNAIAARENRQKKKRYIEGLEIENKALSSENTRLIKDSEQMKSRLSSLEAEVDYLKSVLYNQSALSGLLKKLDSTDVRLSSSFFRRQPQQKELVRPTSGGICLHVNGKDASLELCAQCGLMGGPQL